MQVGYFTMPLHPPGSDLTQTLEEDIEQIVALDRLGYCEAWVGEHYAAPWENICAPDLVLANALARTENIVLGTGVSCLAYHNPFVLAHRIATLDHLAKGRFLWGVGPGSFIGDLEAFGLDGAAGEHRATGRDALEAILELWGDPEPGPREHARWSYTVPQTRPEAGVGLHVKPFQSPHPPIAVAGLSPESETLVLAGERGWIPMSINLIPARFLKTHWASVEQGARAAGLTPDRSGWRVARDVYVAETAEQAREEAIAGTLGRDYEDFFLALFRAMGALDLLKADPDMSDAEVTLEYLADNIWVVGGPDEVAEKLRELHDDVGGFGVLLAMGHEWQPREQWTRSMTLLAEEVMPQLSDLG